MYKLVYKEDLSYNGFYPYGIQDRIPEPNIDITNELRKYLMYIGDFKFKSEPKKHIYTIKDMDFFEKVISTPTDPPISQPTITERLEKVELGLEINLMDVNEVIMPYCLDLDYQVSQINSRLDNLNPVGLDYKIKTNFGGNIMTYTVLKRQIIGQQLELAKALDMIEVFESDRKLNKEQVEELTVLAHSYLK